VSPDQAALRILLDTRLTKSERDTRLAGLACKVSDAIECRAECPECGHYGPHEHNGDRLDPTLCCVECGAHFAEPEVRL
jgi:hypothetical protein